MVPFVFVPRGLVYQGVGAGKPWKEEEKEIKGESRRTAGFEICKRVCLFVYVTYLGGAAMKPKFINQLSFSLFSFSLFLSLPSLTFSLFLHFTLLLYYLTK